jgi:hypothetical protein
MVRSDFWQGSTLRGFGRRCRDRRNESVDMRYSPLEDGSRLEHRLTSQLRWRIDAMTPEHLNFEETSGR